MAAHEGNMDEGKWKWLAISTAIVAVVLGTVQLWDRFWTPAGKLVGRATYNELHYPPPVIAALAKPREVLDSKEFSTSGMGVDKPRGVSDEDWNSAAEQITRRIRSHLFDVLVYRVTSTPEPQEPLLYGGSWTVALTNDGSKSLAKVRVYLPGVELVELRDKTLKTDTVDVGDLQPQEGIAFRGWTRSSSINRRPSLVHESGVGVLTIDGASEVVRFLRP